MQTLDCISLVGIKGLTKPIPEKTLRNNKLVISHAIYHLGRNECIYWGDAQSCSELEFGDNNHLMLSL
jgi:hypothetical protein